MKIFSAAQIRHCDAQTIREEGISSPVLMERAANACLQWIIRHYHREQPFLIICGMGNNGGDGLALTRLLLENGYPASALVLKHATQFSDDASLNLKRLHQQSPEAISILNESETLNGISERLVLIDAIFGTGINRPITGWAGDFIQTINSLPNEKIAIDMPSGLPADNLPQEDAVIFKVQHTLSFQFLKRSFLHIEGAACTGKTTILDIGLSKEFIHQTPALYRLTDQEMLRSFLQQRPEFSHKGDYGTVLLAGGSYGMMGAIALATRAALRSGAGKVVTLAPHCGYEVLQTLCPEAIFQKGGASFLEKMEPEEYPAIGIGPGMGQNPLTKRAFFNFLQKTTRPLILDADALNLLASKPEELPGKLPPGTIITPHPGEFKRLFGESRNSMEQVETGRNQAMRLNITIVLKGHYTTVLWPDGSGFYNPTGNPGMAKGGSGDVLTGIITGLAAQGYTPDHAALLGVWLHGKAGDFAASEKGMDAMTAADICDNLGHAFMALRAD